MDANACRCCGQVSNYIFSGPLLNVDVSYFECDQCGYVQTESPYWLDQAYSEAINDSDTGIMSRNSTNARVVLGAMVLL